MSTNSELASIKNTLETLETFDGSLPGTEAALTAVSAAIEALQISGGSTADLTQIEAELAAINSAIVALVNKPCCPADMDHVLDLLPAPGDGELINPPPAPEDPPPVGANSWDNYYCAAGHALASNMSTKMINIAGLFDSPYFSLGAVIGVIATVAIAGGVTITLPIAFAVAIGYFSSLVSAINFLLNGGGQIEELAAKVISRGGCFGLGLGEEGSGAAKKNAIIANLAGTNYFSDTELNIISFVMLDNVVSAYAFGYGGNILPDVSQYYGMNCLCVEVNCDELTYNEEVVWIFPLNTSPVGQYSSNILWYGRAPLYYSDDSAMGLREGGGGYQATRIGITPPVSVRAACCSILAKLYYTSPRYVGMHQADSSAVLEKPVEIMNDGYIWYTLTPNQINEGQPLWISSSLPTSATNQRIAIKAIVWRWER